MIRIISQQKSKTCGPNLVDLAGPVRHLLPPLRVDRLGLSLLALLLYRLVQLFRVLRLVPLVLERRSGLVYRLDLDDLQNK
jgi:hypothetical protein